MTADDLNAPLGQQQDKRRRRISIPFLPIIAGALALFLGVFVLWAIMGDNPFGGEPMAVAPVDLQTAKAAKPADVPEKHEAAADPAEHRPLRRAAADVGAAQ